MDAELILFAKTPLAGRVKTRLIPELGEQGAADFAGALTEESVRRGVDAWPGPVRLQAWPETAHPCFERIRSRYGVEVSLQTGDDLGARMFAALKDTYRRGAAGAVMGCDIPHCPLETYRAAHAFLAQERSVIGPSADGGYYLIGINPPHPGCFSDIDWGSGTVLETTLKRAAGAAIDVIVLQQLNDIDTAADIEELRATHPEMIDRLMGHERPG